MRENEDLNQAGVLFPELIPMTFPNGRLPSGPLSDFAELTKNNNERATWLVVDIKWINCSLYYVLSPQAKPWEQA